MDSCNQHISWIRPYKVTKEVLLSIKTDPDWFSEPDQRAAAKTDDEPLGP